MFPVLRLSEKNYSKLNRWIMSVIFIVPLLFIALYESTFDKRKHTWMENWFRGNDEGERDTPAHRDPVVDDPRCPGQEISKVPFEELIKVFPDTSVVCPMTILLQ